MKRKVIIMNFSGVYDRERFAQRADYVHLDCTGLRGTDCYCDKEGAEGIRRMIAPYSAEGIHFIDSGDYHYVTKFWTEKLTELFSLVLLDHHTDMQPARWEGLLSCGGWVKDMMESNALLKDVILLGIPRDKVASIPQECRRRVKVLTDEELHSHAQMKSPLTIAGPVYISIDKDVLSRKSVTTNWDQGIMTMSDLERVLRMVMREERVIGVDVCGECAVDDVGWSLSRDSDANGELLDFFGRKEWKGESW